MSFFQNRMLSKSKISWTSPGFYQKPKTRCWFGVARTGVRRHQGHQTPKLESNTTAAVNVRFDCRLKFRVGVINGSLIGVSGQFLVLTHFFPVRFGGLVES